MFKIRTLGIGALGLVLSTPSLHGQDRSRYRDFPSAEICHQSPRSPALRRRRAKTIHSRPAMMQELQWRRPYAMSSTTPSQTDSVQQIVFSFYNNQLSKMVVDYDRDRTAGLTAADLIESISTEYEPQLKRGGSATPGVAPQVEQESGTPVARWGGADFSVVLYRSPYGSGLRIIVTSPRLEALARTAGAQAARLDAREAPRREIARQKKESEDARAAQKKARFANKAGFRA
jgi:hypothetical protein